MDFRNLGDFNEYSFDSNTFRKAIEHFADDSHIYSKDELYSAFLAVTRLYLDELISAKAVENSLIKLYGEKAVNELYETAVRNNNFLADADADQLLEEDVVTAIHKQLELLETLDEEADSLCEGSEQDDDINF